MLKSNVPEIQKNLDIINRNFAQKKDVAPRLLESFDEINSNLNIEDRKLVLATDGSDEVILWKIRGKTYKLVGTEV